MLRNINAIRNDNSFKNYQLKIIKTGYFFTKKDTWSFKRKGNAF